MQLMLHQRQNKKREQQKDYLMQLMLLEQQNKMEDAKRAKGRLSN